MVEQVADYTQPAVIELRDHYEVRGFVLGARMVALCSLEATEVPHKALLKLDVETVTTPIKRSRNHA
jgi:hypothetical protein